MTAAAGRAGAGRPTPVFVLSLPRSGSTLLQRLLAAHSQVATTPEPWLLLPLVYMTRPEGVFAEYDHSVAVRAVTDLYRRVPDGAATLDRLVRHVALETYAGLADGAPVFVDKTPRYALIVDDLLRIFPEAHVVVLWRNPLSVLASLSQSWSSGRWVPWVHKIDLFDGLAALVEAAQRRPSRITALRYEDLVAAPEEELRRLCGALGLDWEPGMVESFADVDVAGTVGDRTGVRAYDAVSAEPVDKWRSSLASPVRRAWARRYLAWVGPRRLAVMGYDHDRLLGELTTGAVDWGRAVSDLASTVKGVAYNLLEPPQVRAKFRALPRLRDVHNHR